LTVSENLRISIEFLRGPAGQPNQITLRCSGLIPGGMYYVMACPKLGQWTQIGAVQTGQDGRLTFTEITAESPRFYRLLK